MGICLEPVYFVPICLEGCFNFPRRQGIGHSNIFTRLEIRLSSDGDLNLDTSVDVDNDLLDDLGGGVEVNETLVDAHLEAVPGLGTLTARGLAGSDSQALGRQADRALGAKVLVLSTVDDLGADLLEDLDLARGEGDADLVALSRLLNILLVLLVRHLERLHDSNGS